MPYFGEPLLNAPTKPPRRFLTPAQAAAQIGGAGKDGSLSAATVIGWIKAGALRAKRLPAKTGGGKLRYIIAAEDFEDFLSSLPDANESPQPTHRRQIQRSRRMALKDVIEFV
jgi:hypothetical protein